MSEGFAEQYTAAARRLVGPLEDAGLEAGAIAQAEGRLGVRLPAALRDYYTVIGNLVQLNLPHNHLFAPADLLLDDGNLVFMVENQGVSYWGVTAQADPPADPPVLVGIRRRGVPVHWMPQGAACSEFLLVMLHYQAVMGGFEFIGTADVSAGLGGRLGPDWRRAGAAGGEEAFGRDGQAVCLPDGLPDRTGKWFFAAARTVPLFAELVAEFRSLGVELKPL